IRSAPHKGAAHIPSPSWPEVGDHCGCRMLRSAQQRLSWHQQGIECEGMPEAGRPWSSTSAPWAMASFTFTYCPVHTNVTGSHPIKLKSILFRNRLLKYVALSAYRVRNRCSTPASNARVSSGLSPGFGRVSKPPAFPNDSANDGSLIPVAYPNRSRVPAKKFPPLSASSDSETLGTNLFPKLWLCTHRPPAITDARGNNRTCCPNRAWFLRKPGFGVPESVSPTAPVSFSNSYPTVVTDQLRSA